MYFMLMIIQVILIIPVKMLTCLFCFQLQLFPTVRVVRTLVTWQATVASFCYRSVQRSTRTKITQGSFCDKRHISSSKNCQKHGGLTVSIHACRSSGPSLCGLTLNPCQGKCLVFLGKTLYSKSSSRLLGL